MSVRPAKTQISLGIRPVWSESSLCDQWVTKDPVILHAISEDWSDWADAQADLSLRWAHMPFCWFCHVAAHFHYFQKLAVHPMIISKMSPSRFHLRKLTNQTFPICKFWVCFLCSELYLYKSKENRLKCNITPCGEKGQGNKIDLTDGNRWFYKLFFLFFFFFFFFLLSAGT